MKVKAKDIKKIMDVYGSDYDINFTMCSNNGLIDLNLSNFSGSDIEKCINFNFTVGRVFERHNYTAGLISLGAFIGFIVGLLYRHIV